VVHTAALLVLEPIFEADFDEAAYGYRPNLSIKSIAQVGASANRSTLIFLPLIGISR